MMVLAALAAMPVRAAEPMPPAVAEPMPPAVAAMIEAAAGDAAALRTVAEVAKKAYPASAAAVDARVAAITEGAKAARLAALRQQGMFEGWSGSGELGFSTSSGNSSTRSLAAALTLNKESEHWRHSLRASFDTQRNNGVTSAERFGVGYEGNYNISPRLYALLTLQFERNRFAGFDHRFTESLGVGYRLIDTATLDLDVEGGPALRQTRLVTGFNERRTAGRAAARLRWAIADGLLFTEAATALFETTTNTFTSETALTAKLTDSLSARASFSLINESEPLPGRRATDTITRLTLVYGF